MKIFNWIVGSFCRTLGRFLFYIAIGFLVMFIISGKVNAKSYSLEDVTTTFDFMPNNTHTYNNKWNTVYYNGTPYDHLSGFRTKFELVNPIEVLNEGRYLISFIVYGEGFINNITCNNLTSNFRNINMTTGNLVANEITSSCIDLYKTTHNGFGAIRLLYEFTYKTNTGSAGITEFDFLINTDYNYFILGGDYGLQYALSVNDIQDYDLNIINTWNTDKALQTQINQNQETNNKLDTQINQNQETNNKLDTQINQNQDIINNQNSTNDKLNDLNSNLTNTDSPNFDSLQNSAGWLPAGPVDSILNLPLSLLNNLTTNLNKSCQPVILPIPYVNKNLTLPCVNTLYDDMGISAWVTTIGVIASAFIMLSYLLKLYRWVDDTLTFRENNQIDNWGGI